MICLSKTGLEYLDLGNNLFNGSIPSSIVNLRGLQLLDLSSNQLAGGEISASFLSILTASFGAKNIAKEIYEL